MSAMREAPAIHERALLIFRHAPPKAKRAMLAAGMGPLAKALAREWIIAIFTAAMFAWLLSGFFIAIASMLSPATRSDPNAMRQLFLWSLLLTSFGGLGLHILSKLLKAPASNPPASIAQLPSLILRFPRAARASALRAILLSAAPDEASLSQWERRALAPPPARPACRPAARRL